MFRICTKCDRELPATREFFHRNSRSPDHLRSRCIPCQKVAGAQRHAALMVDPEVRDSRNERRRQLRKASEGQYRETERQRSLTRKIAVLTHYGNGVMACVCCGIGEIEFLTVDHIDGTDAERPRVNHIHSWLLARGLPEGFQTLCWNCNAAKAYFGICPHQVMSNV